MASSISYSVPKDATITRDSNHKDYFAVVFKLDGIRQTAYLGSQLSGFNSSCGNALSK